MGKHSKFLSISDFCERNGIKTYKFFQIMNRHPELARKMKTGSVGERMLDEEAMMAASAIIRKEKIKEKHKPSVSSAAKEINTLAAQIDELRKEVVRLKCENDRLRNCIRGKTKKSDGS